MNDIEKKLSELNITLPKVAVPVARYLPYNISGNRILVSGQISRDEDGNLMIGRLGDDCDLEKGIKGAERCAHYIMAVLKDAVGGDLSRITKIMRLGGFVNSHPDFKDQPQVINGASDFLVNVFGMGIGMHARAAVGVSALPLGVCVEIEAEAEFI